MNGSTASAFSYLVETLIDLYVTAVLLRLLLQWVRADFTTRFANSWSRLLIQFWSRCDVSFLRSGAWILLQWC